MNFNLTEDQQLFRSIVRDFVAREVTPVAAQIDEAGEFPRPLFARCAENGYFGLRYPEALGGADGDFVTYCLMIEELARCSLSLAAIVAMQSLMGTDFVHRFGMPEHHARLLEPALRSRGRGRRHTLRGEDG